jgi:hypothetical protein
MMVPPHPAAMADPVIKRIGHANMNTQAADMRACADTSRSSAGSHAHTADVDAGAHLSVCGAPEEKHDRKYRSRQHVHFQILRGGRSESLCVVNERPNEEFRGRHGNGLQYDNLVEVSGQSGCPRGSRPRSPALVC